MFRDFQMTTLEASHAKLVEEFGKKEKNLDLIGKILSQIQNDLGSPTAVEHLSTDRLTAIYKDTYEIGALLAVLKSDMMAFEKAILEVLSFYDLSPTPSENKHLMLGLYLMFLLASGNRLSDFHMVLERIPQNEQFSNAYIATPVKLEQSLMEGAYNKVVLTEKNIPSHYYAPFVRIMMDAVRQNIASSVEKSFKMLNTSSATTMLLFDSQSQMAEFAKKRNWKIENDNYVFEGRDTAAHDKQSLDTTRIAKQMIFYAKQLEMIV